MTSSVCTCLFISILFVSHHINPCCVPFCFFYPVPNSHHSWCNIIIWKDLFFQFLSFFISLSSLSFSLFFTSSSFLFIYFIRWRNRRRLFLNWLFFQLVRGTLLFHLKKFPRFIWSLVLTTPRTHTPKISSTKDHCNRNNQDPTLEIVRFSVFIRARWFISIFIKVLPLSISLIR